MLKNVVFIVSNSHSFLTTRKAAFKWLKMMERKKKSKEKKIYRKPQQQKWINLGKEFEQKLVKQSLFFISFSTFQFWFFFLTSTSFFLEHPRSIEANSILKSSLHALSIFPEDTSLESSKVWKIYIIFYFSVVCYCFRFMRSNE